MHNTAQSIYKSLFAGDKITIRLPDKKAFESLRVALCREHQTPKLLLELTNDSLCASYDATQGVGTFWVGPSRKVLSQRTYEIVESVEQAVVNLKVVS